MHHSTGQAILLYTSWGGNIWIQKGEGTKLNKCRATGKQILELRVP